MTFPQSACIIHLGHPFKGSEVYRNFGSLFLLKNRELCLFSETFPAHKLKRSF
ncbi:predicted protein [Enterococcus faecium Com12]|nr:predicted protein [Enterococcus faecium Com12]